MTTKTLNSIKKEFEKRFTETYTSYGGFGTFYNADEPVKIKKEDYKLRLLSRDEVWSFFEQKLKEVEELGYQRGIKDVEKNMFKMLTYTDLYNYLHSLLNKKK